MKTLHLINPIAIAVLAVACGAANASTASATLSNLRIDLVSLDTGAAVAPSVTFESGQGGTFVGAETGTADRGQIDRSTDIQFGNTAFGEALASSSKGSATAFSVLAGDPFGGGATVSTFASLSTPGAYGASTVMLGDGANYASFTLSGRTRLVISADASVSVTSTINDPNVDTWASAFLKLTDYTGAGAISYSGTQLDQGSTLGGTPCTSTDDEHFEVAFDNLDTSSVDGIFFGSVDAQASDIGAVGDVPEPARATLMLAGLGLLAWLTRRTAASR